MPITFVHWQLIEIGNGTNSILAKAVLSCGQFRVKIGSGHNIFHIVLYHGNMWENIINTFDQLHWPLYFL